MLLPKQITFTQSLKYKVPEVALLTLMPVCPIRQSESLNSNTKHKLPDFLPLSLLSGSYRFFQISSAAKYTVRDALRREH